MLGLPLGVIRLVGLGVGGFLRRTHRVVRCFPRAADGSFVGMLLLLLDLLRAALRIHRRRCVRGMFGGLLHRTFIAPLLAAGRLFAAAQRLLLLLRRLSLIELANVFRRAAAALRSIQRNFLAVQVRDLRAALSPGLGDAVVHGEEAVALLLAGIEVRLDLFTLGLDAGAFCSFGGVSAFDLCPRRGRHKEQREDGKDVLHGQVSRVQVSRVSTARCSSARNSFDCISRMRETVRVNSCASGPSVYNASGSTAADMFSFTRLS